jgi:hypothetical protein
MIILDEAELAAVSIDLTRARGRLAVLLAAQSGPWPAATPETGAREDTLFLLDLALLSIDAALEAVEEVAPGRHPSSSLRSASLG